MPGFLDDIPGVKDLRNGEGGSLVPRRNVLVVKGATVSDDPEAGETVVEFASTAEFEAVDASAPLQITNTDADVYRITGGAGPVYGLDAPGTADRHLVHLLNAGTEAVPLAHDSEAADAAADRFFVAGEADYELQPGEFIEAMYDRNIARWRITA